VDSLNENTYILAAEAVKHYKAVIITAGAGIGVDSGLPDFRGNSGFWKEYPAISGLGISFAEMANPRWFELKPKLAWAFYGHRFNLYRDTLPHEGFHKLLEMVLKKEYGYFVFTSNVDGQFQKAGFSDDKIEEVHGSINFMQCTRPCSSHIIEAEDRNIHIDKDKFEALDPLPICPKCGALARPNILMFGDWTWISKRSDEQSERLMGYLHELKVKKVKPLIIEIGAGKAVSTVRSRSEQWAQEFNTELIRINPRDFDIPPFVKGIEIQAGSLEGINRIVNRTL
jgi:NAD-dependent SIR2 family protein deacetylase